MLEGIALELWVFAAIVTVFAGIVKGAVGFAMPMIMISGISSFASPEFALAALIVPTVMTNAMQTFRFGLAEAWAAVRRFRVYIVILLVMIALSAQAVALVSTNLLLMIVGVPVTILSATQLAGWQPHIAEHRARLVEVVVAFFAGILGGMGGVWGPLTTSYLTAINTPKTEQVRVQGAVYGVAGVVLMLAHMRSGILTWPTFAFSTVMLAPAVLGMMIGFRLHDRLDQAKFKRLTLVVLVIAGLNLIRRGLFG